VRLVDRNRRRIWGGQGGDPGRGHRDEWASELRRECGQPTRSDHDVAVQEGTTGVVTSASPVFGAAADLPRIAGPTNNARFLAATRRTGVASSDASSTTRTSATLAVSDTETQQAIEFAGTVPDRDDDCRCQFGEGVQRRDGRCGYRQVGTWLRVAFGFSEASERRFLGFWRTSSVDACGFGSVRSGTGPSQPSGEQRPRPDIDVLKHCVAGLQGRRPRSLHDALVDVAPTLAKGI
jgi:hypothetical protein